MLNYRDLRNEQARQIIDVDQVFATNQAARVEFDSRYAGSMSWKGINGGLYLYRKVKGSNRSLGVRSPETENAHRAFREGRARLKDRRVGLTERLDEMAPVNNALGIGRVPATSARILRQIAAAGLMGSAIDIVGTNALYAYERMGGVQVDSGLSATGDIDLLFDARSNLKLAAKDLRSEGLMGLLRKVDESFALAGQRSVRAINDEGFMVDLITPMPKNRFSDAGRAGIGDDADVRAVEIEGRAWLVNSTKHDAVVLDERGYPIRMSVPDPRSFALHKAWLSSRDDRDPIKRRRDGAQARLVAELVTERLPHLAFDGHDLSAMPLTMRRAVGDILPIGEGSDEASRTTEPDW